MKYYGFGTFTGEENMKIDSDILEESIKNEILEPVFRLYAWSPKCISIGRNQKADFLTEQIDSVRRLTGGRALLHDDEITYSYVSPISIIPDGNDVVKSYKYISGIIINFFKTFGIELDFGENKKISTKFDYCMLVSTGADVCYKGEKIIGSAQFRKNGYLLQHGSILFGYDKKLLEQLFKEDVKGITTVRQIIPNLSKDEFVEKFEEYILKL